MVFLTTVCEVERLCSKRLASFLNIDRGSEDVFDRPKDYRQIKHQRAVLEIVEVVLELYGRILDRGAGAVVDLRPAGDSREDSLADMVVGDVAVVKAG